jgi:penicillin-binding protein 2
MILGQTLRDQQHELSVFRNRLMLAGVLILAAFALLLARFTWLQVVQREHYHTLAEANRISVAPVVPNRGLILDRNGEVLAANYSAYTLEITPSKVGNVERAIDELARVIDVAPRDRRRFRKLQEESKTFESLPIRTRLTEEEVARFAVNRFRFPGFEIKARLFRSYPQGEVASHAIGYIGRINDADLGRIDNLGLATNYKGTDHIGKLGIEGAYENELHGTTGSEQVEVDAGGRAIRSLARSEPLSGNNLTLTLDLKLQRVAEEAFQEFRGALVAIDPRTGEVLALVSKPGFDPNLFVDGIDPVNWDALNNSPDKPLNNRALRGQYPPGFHHQALHGAGGAREQEALTGLHHLRRGFLHPSRRAASLSRLEERGPRDGEHAQVDRDLVRYVLLRPRGRHGHRHDSTRSSRVSDSARRPASTSTASCRDSRRARNGSGNATSRSGSRAIP